MLTASRVPAHSAIVHFPIAFNILAWALDVLYALTTTFIRPQYLTSRYGDRSTLLEISKLSYFLLCLGLLTSVPAIMSGNAQLFAMIQRNGGVWEKDAHGGFKQSMVPRIKATITHAFMNNIIFVVNLYSWHLRRSRPYSVSMANAPNGTNMTISFALLPLLLAASKFGGTLVFNHGIGLSLGRKQIQVDLKEI